MQKTMDREEIIETIKGFLVEEFEVDEETGVQLHYGKDYVYGGDFQMDENKTEVYKEPDPKYTHEHNKKLLKIQHNKLMEK